MKAVLKLPPAIRTLRVAADALDWASALTDVNGRWPAPSATEPTADRTTKSLRFITGSPLREQCGSAESISQIGTANERGERAVRRAHSASRRPDAAVDGTGI